MEQLGLSIKRSQSDNLFSQPKIISPAPTRRPSKISFNVAREVFGLPHSMEELDSNSMSGSLSTFALNRFHSLRMDNDSMGSEWESDSSYSTSIQGDYESPTKPGTKNPLLGDGWEELSSEIVPRASNPLVHDKNFMRCDQEGYMLDFGSTLISRP